MLRKRRCQSRNRVDMQTDARTQNQDAMSHRMWLLFVPTLAASYVSRSVVQTGSAVAVDAVQRGSHANYFSLLPSHY